MYQVDSVSPHTRKLKRKKCPYKRARLYLEPQHVHYSRLLHRDWWCCITWQPNNSSKTLRHDAVSLLTILLLLWTVLMHIPTGYFTMSFTSYDAQKFGRGSHFEMPLGTSSVAPANFMHSLSVNTRARASDMPDPPIPWLWEVSGSRSDILVLDQKCLSMPTMWLHPGIRLKEAVRNAFRVLSSDHPFGRLTALSNEIPDIEGWYSKEMLIDPANVTEIRGCISTGPYITGLCLLRILCSGGVGCFFGGGGLTLL
jgi:hypothetical protein